MRAICPANRAADTSRLNPRRPAPTHHVSCSTVELLDNLDVLLLVRRSFGNPIANRGVMEVVDPNHIEKVILLRSHSRLSYQNGYVFTLVIILLKPSFIQYQVWCLASEYNKAYHNLTVLRTSSQVVVKATDTTMASNLVCICYQLTKRRII